MTFQNKIAVITGAGGTLCSEIARDLAQNGAKAVLVGRTKEKLDAVASAIRENGGDCMVYPCDVTNQTAVAELANCPEHALVLDVHRLAAHVDINGVFKVDPRLHCFCARPALALQHVQEGDERGFVRLRIGGPTPALKQRVGQFVHTP